MLASHIARRFLFSRKSHSVVNLIAIVSVVAIAVPTAAMILVLSLHNGIYDHLQTLYSKFDSPLRVTAASGQFFEVDSSQMQSLRSLGVVSSTLDCNALLEYTSRQSVAVVRGVDSAYRSVNSIEQTITRGEWRTQLGDRSRAVVGAGLSYNLGLSLGVGEPIHIYAILPTPPIFRILELPLINDAQVEASGVFEIESSIDGRYLITDIALVRKLTGQLTAISSLEIRPTTSIENAKTQLRQILGDQVVIEDNFEQRAMIYSVIESEKWIVYLVLTLVALIASMSLIGCTLMMISEKREATATLQAIGMNNRKIRQIFIRLSMIIVTLGVGSGLVIGVGLSYVQLYFEPLQMAGETLVNNSYLVAIYPLDIIITSISMLAIGSIMVIATVGRGSTISKTEK